MSFESDDSQVIQLVQEFKDFRKKAEENVLRSAQVIENLAVLNDEQVCSTQFFAFVRVNPLTSRESSYVPLTKPGSTIFSTYQE